MTTLKIGIDEAGRGPVIGPMVVAGVLITPEHEKELRRLCVKDSKQVTPKRREFLYEKIIKLVKEFHYERIHPEEIDNHLNNGTNLNQLEAIAFSKIINKLNKKNQKIKLYLDCPSISINKWRDSLKRILKNLSNLEIICEHKADSNYVVVATASIIAKYHREKEMDKLREKYGSEIGSGYTSDPLTIKFLKKNIIKLKKEKIFRKSWITYKKTLEISSQEKLF